MDVKVQNSYRVRTATTVAMLAALYAALVTESQAAVFATNKVMLSGDAAPGTNGFFTGIGGAPSINDLGEVIFNGFASGQQTGPSAWRFDGATVGNVLLLDDLAPGIPGRAVTSARQVGINENGNIVFIGDLQGPFGDPIDDRTIWRTRPNGSIDLIAQRGVTQAPSTTATFNPLGGTRPAMDGSGRIAFQSALRGATVATDSGIWAEFDSTLESVAIEGDAAPGTGQFFAGSFADPARNDLGTVAFHGSTGDQPDGSSDGTGIWTRTGNTLEKVAATGDVAPGVGADRFFAGFDNRVALNNAGETAFIVSLKNEATQMNEGEGVWVAKDGVFRRVVQHGDAAPGAPAGFEFDHFDALVMNATGRTMFRGEAELPPVGPDLGGIWRETPNGLELVALQGQLAPGTTDGAIFTQDFNSMTYNELGQSAFVVQLGGPGVGSDFALYFVDEYGDLSLVVREDGFFEVAPGDIRLVERLFYSSDFGRGSGNQDGRPSGMNEFGDMTFALAFADDSVGVFTVQPFVDRPQSVPEPRAALFFGIGLVLVAMGCHRRRA